MPYEAATQTQKVVAMSVDVYLEVPSKAVQGDKITFTGYVKINGQAPGKMLPLEIWSSINNWASPIVTGYTFTDGTWSIVWTVPYGVACREYSFRATVKIDGTPYSSPLRSMLVSYRTRIRLEAPSNVLINQPFTVTGYLEYENPANTWNPLGGRTVSIYLDGAKITDVTTDSSGKFSASLTITSPGDHTVEARFAGELPTRYAIAVAAASPAAIAQNTLAYAAAFSPLIAAALLITLDYVK